MDTPSNCATASDIANAIPYVKTNLYLKDKYFDYDEFEFEPANSRVQYYFSNLVSSVGTAMVFQARENNLIRTDSSLGYPEVSSSFVSYHYHYSYN